MSATDDGQRRTGPEPPLTDEQQAEWYAEWQQKTNKYRMVRADVARQFPYLSRANLDIISAEWVIRGHLGGKWVERHIKGEGHRGADRYLRSKPVSMADKREHYVRVMELARRLFELGQESFFAFYSTTCDNETWKALPSRRTWCGCSSRSHE